MKTTQDQDNSLTPNAALVQETRAAYQPVRPSSTSLAQFDTLHKKSAKKIKERPARGKIPKSITYRHEDLLVEVTDSLQFDEITDKVHNLALIKFVQSHNDTIVITLAEYMKATGLKDRKTAREQLAHSIHNLVGLKVSRNNLSELSQKQRKYEPFTHDMVIYINGDYTRGKGKIIFNPTFTEALENTTSAMIYPKTLFQLKGTAYYLLNALLYNKQVNYRNSESKQNRMKFRSILKRCPNLPTWKDVQKGNRNYGDRIIKPLKKAINELSDEISCSFIDAEGKTQPSIDNLPIDNFLNCDLVVTNWKNLNIEQLNKMKKKKKSNNKKKTS